MRTFRRSKGSLIVIGLLAVACVEAENDGGNVVQDNLGRPEVAPGQYFVGFKSNPGAAHRAAVTGRGGTILREFPADQAFAIRLADSKVGALASDGLVNYVEAMPLRYASSLSTSQVVPALDNGLYGLVKIKATAAHARGVIGTGVVVGVADTALDCDHPDIAANLIASTDHVAHEPADSCVGTPHENHATHVSGTILGVNNGQGVYGVAYGAKLLHARVLGSDGGTTAEVMDGVQWLVDNGAKVINLSLGGGRASRTEQKFYDRLRSQGILVAAAAGNESARKLGYPAGYTSNISVGAIDVNDAHADFSNIGRGLDVSAPGVDVLSSVPVGEGSESSVSAGGTTYRALGMEFAPHTNASGVNGTLVNCGIGNPTDFPASVAGNIAVIQRGTLSFVDKVNNAKAAGAAAAIIYNNVAGELSGTLGAEGDYIPAVGVSDVTGAALVAVAGSSGNVTSVTSNWDYYSGTSMATPHTAGTIALIWSKNPGLTNLQVESKLFSTCDDLGAAGYDTTFGNGRIDADESTL